MQSMDNYNDCRKFLKYYNCWINSFVTDGNLKNSLKHFFHESQCYNHGKYGLLLIRLKIIIS